MKSLYITPLIVLSVTALAFGQVAPVQNGQALDANPQVGSGGYNTVNGGLGGVNSQLYINGQVTGLGAFHGHVPYSSVDQFHANTGSGGFDAFQRQSVGVRDAMSPQVYQATPYVSPYTSVPQMQALATGQIPMLPKRTDSSVQNAYNNATADYQSLLTMPPPLRTTGTNSAPAYVPPQLQGYGSSAGGVAMPRDFTPSDATFGAPRALRDRLSRDLRMVDAQVDRQVDARVDAFAGPSDKVPTANWNKDLAEPRPDDDKNPGGNTAKPAAGNRTTPNTGKGSSGKNQSGYERDGVIYPRANQDVFVDLLVNLQAKRNMGSGSDDRSPRGKNTPTPTPGASPATPPDSRTRVQESPAPGDYVVDIGEDRSVVLHALAGSSTDMFNLQMRKAQVKLRAGKFYDAAGDFETACIIDSGNPLPHLGQGLATFAAGEPFNASMQVRRAMEMFPPIMETRMDLPSLMDSKSFANQLASLDERITGSEKNELPLVFLATFMHYTARQDDQSRDCAKRLQELAGDDKLMKAYADFVLTGKRPGKTAPASK